MTWRSRLWRRVRGISFQLGLLISLAVLPIGIVSVVQSVGFAREVRHSAETLLRGLTRESASLDHRLIETGLHVNPDLVAAVTRTRTSPAACSKLLEEFVALQPIFRSVRFVGLDGMSRCTSQGPELDLSLSTDFLQFSKDPVSAVDRFGWDKGGKVPVLLFTQPVREGDSLLGYLSLVVPSIQLLQIPSDSGVPVPTEVILFNQAGTILASTKDLQDVEDRLPPSARVMALLNGPDAVLDGEDAAGKASTFVKVTLIRDTVAAIGIWPQDNPISQTSFVWSNVVVFPLLMWALSLSIALFSARRLVIRPIQRLRDEMRRFALGQRNPPLVLPPGAALEIQEAVNTFGKLELIVTRNENALALTAEGKLLLLREVHHRIKNNLQMISSIISIQRRKSEDGDVKLVLRSLQDRVMSIAAVDQSLYLNGDVWDVQADVLIASITNRLIGVNLEQGHAVLITTDYDSVLLHADQIGPLSLLANEAVTNALKYVGKPKGGRAFVNIRLKRDGDMVCFTVLNSTGQGLQNADAPPDSTSLGMTLIRAFCDQLAADFQSGYNRSESTFSLSVKFLPSALSQQGPPPDAAG